MPELAEIPMIDLSKPDTDIIADFAKAYSETGFAYIHNHGVSQSLIDATFAASATFHALPEPTKQAVSLNHIHRGYIPINTSTDVNSKLADVKKPNQSSSFMMMREDAGEEDGVYLSGPNQWPDLPNFRQTLQTYNAEMSTLARRLMTLAIRASNADPAQILPAFDTPTTWLRLLHYPPTAPQSPDDLYGSAPHTDFGCLTLLAQDGVGGLQVQTPAKTWIDAPFIPQTFVVNVGDMLHRLSNGFLKSTPHRVINRSGRERYSIPFFFDPHVNTTIAPLNGTGPPKFPPIHFGDFLRHELESSYNAHKNP